MGLLLVLLLFFSTPSKAEQVACLVIAVVLVFDVIMILAVPKIRMEEGWVGIASVVWALIIAIWTGTFHILSNIAAPQANTIQSSLIVSSHGANEKKKSV